MEPGRSVKCLLVRKARRCKFCRSKAKYLPGQRSLDTVSAKLFRRKKSPEPVRRAASEDRLGRRITNIILYILFAILLKLEYWFLTRKIVTKWRLYSSI